MKNGLYRVEFQTPMGSGTGVGYVKDGKFHGGDSIIYYVGDVSVNDNNVTAVIRTNAHSKAIGMNSVFGIDSVNITLNGAINGNVIQLNGTAKEAPQIPFKANLTWLCD